MIGAKQFTEDWNFAARQSGRGAYYILRSSTVRYCGVCSSENADMSSVSADEISACRISKVSSAMSINWGLVGSKELPSGSSDVQVVNIRLLFVTRYQVWNDEVWYKWPSTWGFKHWAQVKCQYNRSREWERYKLRFPEKFYTEFYKYPYRKPTQVEWSSRPRQMGNGGSRNSAKKLSVSFSISSVPFGGLQQTFINRLFSKNIGLCKPEMERIEAETCPVLVS